MCLRRAVLCISRQLIRPVFIAQTTFTKVPFFGPDVLSMLWAGCLASQIPSQPLKEARDGLQQASKAFTASFEQFQWLHLGLGQIWGSGRYGADLGLDRSGNLDPELSAPMPPFVHDHQHQSRKSGDSLSVHAHSRSRLRVTPRSPLHRSHYCASASQLQLAVVTRGAPCDHAGVCSKTIQCKCQL